MVWRASDPQGMESAKIVWELPRYTRGRGLDLGCGPHKVFPHAIGVDNYKATQQFGVEMRPDVACDCERLEVFGSASMDWVFSSHLLEHIKDYKAALKDWFRVVKQGGHLILYVPHKELYPNVGQPGANPDHVHDFMPEDLIKAMRDCGGWDLLRNEKRDQDREYSIFQVYRKRSDGKQIIHESKRAEKTCCVVRYGGLGDMIQMSSVLPGLKDQGFHVTVMTTPRGKEVVQHDPHIDDFYIVDTDQIPNHHLANFWDWESKKYDRFINLSESVEGTFLALPGRTSFLWPHDVRHKHLNGNYAEFTHDLAGVPMPTRQMFYATPEEKAWARKERVKLGGDSLIMYSLSGSSVHKVWPWMDQLIARVMVRYPGAHIVTVGSALDFMLEAGWEKEPRVKLRSGKYSVRETMSLVEQCDMVVGPETGILNAASNLALPKLILMSHSSPNNLTKHWQNTTAIEPDDTPCYPCHRMLHGFDYCNRSEQTGTAMCATNIGIDKVWNAFESIMERRKLAA